MKTVIKIAAVAAFWCVFLMSFMIASYSVDSFQLIANLSLTNYARDLTLVSALINMVLAMLLAWFYMNYLLTVSIYFASMVNYFYRILNFSVIDAIDFARRVSYFFLLRTMKFYEIYDFLLVVIQVNFVLNVGFLIFQYFELSFLRAAVGYLAIISYIVALVLFLIFMVIAIIMAIKSSIEFMCFQEKIGQ